MFDELSLRKQVIFLQERLLELSEAVESAATIMEVIRQSQANMPFPFNKSEVFTMARDWVNKYTEEK